jgi:hypothetical protein
MNYGLVLHLIHVAGTRMKDQGTDGLSRGDLLEGVMKGNVFLGYIPISSLCLYSIPVGSRMVGRNVRRWGTA